VICLLHGGSFAWTMAKACSPKTRPQSLRQTALDAIEQTKFYLKWQDRLRRGAGRPDGASAVSEAGAFTFFLQDELHPLTVEILDLAADMVGGRWH
jgi:isoleucyl-tRNA synthetase